jgi:hypothetical protein
MALAGRGRKADQLAAPRTDAVTQPGTEDGPGLLLGVDRVASSALSPLMPL